jgi:transcriptional regulator GlxA family with amidase domain
MGHRLSETPEPLKREPLQPRPRKHTLNTGSSVRHNPTAPRQARTEPLPDALLSSLLALVEEDLGSDAARQVAQVLIVFMQRPGGQSQFSTRTVTGSVRHATLRTLLDAVVVDPAGDHSLSAMASRAAFSERHLTRLFAEQLDTTPARYVERVRVEAARGLLERGDDSLNVVAKRSGFGSEETLRLAFVRHLGVSPGGYRAHFRTTGI